MHKTKITSQTIVLLLFLVVLSSCATKYGPVSHSLLSSKYGYSDSPIDSVTWQVIFSGNEATSVDVVERYALFRAAELTTEKGYDYFIVLDRNIEAQTITHTGPPMTNSSTEPWSDPLTGAHGTVTTTTTTRDIDTGTAHSSMKMIRMFKGQKPADMTQSYDAKAMLKLMSQSIDR